MTSATPSRILRYLLGIVILYCNALVAFADDKCTDITGTYAYWGRTNNAKNIEFTNALTVPSRAAAGWVVISNSSSTEGPFSVAFLNADLSPFTDAKWRRPVILNLQCKDEKWQEVVHFKGGSEGISTEWTKHWTYTRDRELGDLMIELQTEGTKSDFPFELFQKKISDSVQSRFCDLNRVQASKCPSPYKE